MMLPSGILFQDSGKNSYVCRHRTSGCAVLRLAQRVLTVQSVDASRPRTRLGKIQPKRPRTLPPGNSGDTIHNYWASRKEESEKYGLTISGYCLMTNHVHLIATPEDEESLAKTLGRTHLRYTQYINRFHKRSGHLWQNRFYSCALDEEHCWTGLAYVGACLRRGLLTSSRTRCERGWSVALGGIAGRARRPTVQWARIRPNCWTCRLGRSCPRATIGKQPYCRWLATKSHQPFV